MTSDAGQRGGSFEEQMAQLRHRFVQRLPELLDDLRASWMAARQTGADETHHADFHRRIHSLKGTSGSFGLLGISTAAREFELELDTLEQEGAGISSDAGSAVVEESLGRLQTLVQETQVDECVDLPCADPEHRSSHPDHSARLIYIMDEDTAEADAFAAALIEDGMDARPLYRLEAFASAARRTSPALAILGITFPDDQATDVIRQLRDQGMNAPIIFIAEEGGTDQRMRAIRAGGVAYFTRPVDHGAVIEIARSLLEARQEPLRIVICDDDEILAEHYAIVLRHAGVECTIVDAPARFFDVMEKAKPDLVLMDQNMPDYSGSDLTTAIRQDPTYSRLPILFLSAEDDPQRQQEAMAAGADHFLTKPIAPNELVRAVVTHARRARDRGRGTITGALSTSTPPATSAVAAPGESSPIQVGTLLAGSEGEHYEILELLASGGMGRTYRARRTSDGARMVVKCLLPAGNEDTPTIMRFVQEARLLLQLDHPNLVKARDLQQTLHLAYFVMDYLEGKTVEQLLERQKVLTDQAAVRIVLGVARALYYLDEQGVIHRDIKPGNILVDESGEPCLIDFGIARESHRNVLLTTMGIVLGTPAYLSPEQVLGERLDIRSDIYSLGATFYHIVTGELPFDDESTSALMNARLQGSPDPCKCGRPLHPSVCSLISEMMHRQKKRRPQTAEELVVKLELLLGAVD